MSGTAVRWVPAFLAGALACAIHAAGAQPARTILAVGAHAGDAELTVGPLLASESARGSRVIILDLTLGERGHPTLAPAQYAAQKRREAEAFAGVIGAELEIGPWNDAEIPNDEAARRWVAAVIRRVRPNLVLTHWKKSMHRDHAATSAIVQDAVLLAALPGVAGVDGAPHRGATLWYAENWEDAEDFTPFIYVGVDSASWARWKTGVAAFAFARGATGFPYIEYYDALGRVRGIEARRERAIAFDVEAHAKRRVLDADALPAAPAPAASIPPRAPDAPTGSAFIAAVANVSRETRETAIRRELLAGNIPAFLRRLHAVTDTVTDAAGRQRVITYEVMPDYLAIGSDEDFVRMPMNPYTAQTFCDAFGFVLPTRKMVNDIWSAATVRVEPRPLTQEREAPETFLQHHRIIEAQLQGSPRGALVAGIKKDVVVTNELRKRSDRVAIYGWHYLSGRPIQPLYTGHVDWYVDYSHGIRPVRRSMLVDGAPRTFQAILADSILAPLLSDEGAIPVPRYQR